VGRGRAGAWGVDATSSVTGSAGETFLSTIQRAAEVVANAVRPGPDNPCTKGPLPYGDSYQPAVTPSASHTHPNPGNLLPGAILGARGMEARVATLRGPDGSFMPRQERHKGRRQEALPHFVCLEFLELWDSTPELRTRSLVSS
jgi:hypothetical protein